MLRTLHSESDISHDKNAGLFKDLLQKSITLEKEPVVIFGEVNPAIIGGPELFTRFAKGMDHTRQYINESNRAIKVVLRNNIAFEVKNAGTSVASVTNKFIVRDIYRIPAYMFNELHDYMSNRRSEALGNHEYSDSREFCQALIDIRQRDHDNGTPNTATRSVTIDTEIPLRNIIDAGTMYVGNLDIVLSATSYAQPINHPFHLREQVINKLLNLKNNNDGFIINVEFIDNDNKYQTKYLSFMGMLFIVNPIKNPAKRDGVYITAIDYTDNNEGELMDTSFIWPSPMDVDTAYKVIGLSNTKEEAYSLGNVKMLMETKVLEQKQVLVEKEHNGALIAMEQKRLMAEMQAADIQKALELKERERQWDLEYKERERQIESEYRERERQNEIKHKELIRNAEALIARAKENEELTKRITERKDREAETLRQRAAKLEEDRLDLIKAERDDFYEDRHHRRKDEGEILKHIPTLLVGGWGLMKLYSTLTEK